MNAERLQKSYAPFERKRSAFVACKVPLSSKVAVSLTFSSHLPFLMKQAIPNTKKQSLLMDFGNWGSAGGSNWIGSENSL